MAFKPISFGYRLEPRKPLGGGPIPSGPLPIKKLAGDLRRGERGAVVTDNIRFPDGGLQIEGQIELDPQIVRSALLFVDRLDYPDRRIPIGTHVFKEADWEGRVDRTEVDLQGLITGSSLRRAPYDVFRAHDNREPGAWTIWATEEQSVIPDGETAPDLGFLLEFQNALVVPAADVPIDQILSFKTRHVALLEDLRHHLEALCVKISGEGVDQRLIRIETEQFERTLSAYLVEARKTKFRKVIVGAFSVEMDYSKAVRDMLTGAARTSLATLAAGMPLAQAAAAIGLGAVANLTIKSGPGLKKPAPSPFRYIAKAYREFG